MQKNTFLRISFFVIYRIKYEKEILTFSDIET